MTRLRIRKAVLPAILAVAFTAAASAAPAWDKVAEALGRPGAVMAGGIYRVGLPRTDLKVTVDGVGNKAAITGDFVLLAKEVNPVLQTLRASGIEDIIRVAAGVGHAPIRARQRREGGRRTELFFLTEPGARVARCRDDTSNGTTVLRQSRCPSVGRMLSLRRSGNVGQ